MLMLVSATNVWVNAAIYRVEKTGSDSNPGTAAKPFLTVQKAVNAARAGDQILVGPGEYPESVRSAASGEAGAPIVIDGQNVAIIRQCVLYHQYNYVLNFKMRGLTTMYETVMMLNRGAHHCVVSNNIVDVENAPKVYGVGWNSPVTPPFGNGEAASDVLIVSNVVKRVYATTMVNIYGDRNVIRGNTITDGVCVDFFRIWGRNNNIAGNFVSNNIFENGVGNHPDIFQTFGDLGFGAQNIVIEGNLITHVEAGALAQMNSTLVDSLSDWTIRNNLFSDVGMAASCTVPNVKYYHNIFLRCNKTNGGHALNFGTRTFTMNGKTGTDYANGCKVWNNAFIDCGDGRKTVGWYYFQTNLVNVSADYNFVTLRDFTAAKEDAQHRVIGDPRSWDYLCQTWWEDHGINGGDPGFVGLDTRSPSFTANAAVKGKGLYLLGNDFDLRLNRRPNPPSIGPIDSAAVLILSAPGGIRDVPE